MAKIKLKKTSERNAFEQFLFRNADEIYQKEVLDANQVAEQLGVSIVRLREWARCSHYTTYIRGGVKNKALVVVEVDLLRQASEILALQEAEEEKEAALVAYTNSYIKNVIAGDVSAALMLLQSAAGVKGIADSLRALLAKACTAVELVNAEITKEK